MREIWEKSVKLRGNQGFGSKWWENMEILRENLAKKRKDFRINAINLPTSIVNHLLVSYSSAGKKQKHFLLIFPFYFDDLLF